MPSQHPLKAAVRTINGFPKPGVQFRDVSPLFADPTHLQALIMDFAACARRQRSDAIAAIDARGFLIAGALAIELSLPIVLVRKQGKLPGPCLKASYQLEYGSATVEVQQTDLVRDRHVLIVDDLLATGGTALAAANLLRQLGARQLSLACIIELTDLPGRQKLESDSVHVDSLLHFTEDE